MKTQTPSLALSDVFTMQNLLHAWEKVSIKNSAPGIDGVRVNDFARQARPRLEKLQDELLGGNYTPQPYITFPKSKKGGGVRELTISTVRDRIAARAAASELGRHYDRRLMPQSFAYRPHKGALKAVAAVERHLGEATHVLRADIADFFNQIDYDLLHHSISDFGVGADFGRL